jgi:hypothetical protein
MAAQNGAAILLLTKAQGFSPTKSGTTFGTEHIYQHITHVFSPAFAARPTTTQGRDSYD